MQPDSERLAVSPPDASAQHLPSSDSDETGKMASISSVLTLHPKEAAAVVDDSDLLSERLAVSPQDSSAQPSSSPDLDDAGKMASISSVLTLHPKEAAAVVDDSYLLPVIDKKKDSKAAKAADKREREKARMFEEQCRQLSITLFANEETSIKSLGFTSSIEGEGKTFLATVTARILARDSLQPVTLVELNWTHPTLSQIFDIPTTPGLAEWLNGKCDEREIRYQVEDNLTVIPAGNGSREAVKLLKRIQQHGLQKTFGQNRLLVLDLPSMITTSYGTLAASLAETVVVVVRSEVTPGHILAEACAKLKSVPIHGVILNQGQSRIPRWIRQIL